MNAQSKLTFVLLAIVIGGLGAPASTSAAGEGWVVTEIDEVHNTIPQDIIVSGDRVTWPAWDTTGSGEWDIWTWTPTEGLTQVTKNDANDYVRGVSGDRIVGNTDDGTDYEIFTWTPDQGLELLTQNDYDDWVFGLSGERLVWIREPAGSGIELLTGTIPNIAETTIISNFSDPFAPMVSGDHVVYRDFNTTNGTWDICVWTPAGTITLDNPEYDDRYAVISGDRVAWIGSDADSDVLFTWTQEEGITALTSGSDTWPVNDNYPGISGDRVVWARYDADDSGLYFSEEIVTWTPEGGVQQVTNNENGDYGPEVSGDRIVWTGLAPGYEVFTWTPDAGVTQLTDNGVWDYHPQVSGDRVAWTQVAGSISKILTAVPVEVAVVEQAQRIIDDYDAAIDDGTLAGSGPGQSADGRANALYNKLLAAKVNIENGDYTAALALLYDVYKLCDGSPKPDDFVEGDARDDIAAKVSALIALLETF